MNKGVLAKTHFFVKIIHYNDVLDRFEPNFLLEKSPKPLFGDIMGAACLARQIRRGEEPSQIVEISGIFPT